MRVTFLAPVAALAALAALVPLAAALFRERRARRLRAALRLRAPGLRGQLPAALAVLTVALLSLAAARPVLHVPQTRFARTDAELLFVVDSTRSMLASAGPEEPRRFDRGIELSLRMRDAFPEVPAGLASVRDRPTLHLLPTIDRAAFAGVATRAMGVDRPPPLYARELARATDLEAIKYFGTDGYFAEGARKRVLVVLTDGESRELEPDDVVPDLVENGVRLVLVHVWEPGERVYRGEQPEPYRPDPRSRGDLRDLAAAARGAVHAETDVEGAIERTRDYVASGRRVAAGEDERAVELAPYLIGASALPLALLLASASGLGRRAEISA